MENIKVYKNIEEFYFSITMNSILGLAGTTASNWEWAEAQEIKEKENT